MTDAPSSIIAAVITFILGFFSACNAPVSTPTYSNEVALEMLLLADTTTISSNAMQSALNVIEKRLNHVLIDAIVVDQERILLNLPTLSAEELERVLRLATQQGVLSFHVVKDSAATIDSPSFSDLEAAAFSESIVSQAELQFDDFGQNSIAFSIAPEYQDDFGQLTQNNIGKRLAIVFDGDVLIAPSIQGRISEGGIISGGDTLEETQELVAILNSGPLPFPFILEVIREAD